MSGTSRKQPRLVHLTTTDVSLALLLGPQLRAFAAAGFEVIAVSAPGPYVAALEADGIRHIPLRHATRAAAVHHDLLALAELRALFRDLAPDIVHTHNPKPGVYGRLAARAAGVGGIVNTVHGLYALPTDRWTKRAVVYSLERLAATCSAVELVQNIEDIDVLARIGVPKSRIRLLGNGVDLRRFNPDTIDAAAAAALRAQIGAGPDDVVCGAVGRLVWEKGYRELLAAAVALRTSHPHVRMVVVGPHDPDKSDGLSSEDVRRAVEDSGVTFLGERHDVETVYAAMDLYVLASYREGFPRSAMEAAAMGLPVVATDIRGSRQVVDHGHTGLLVPPRNAEALGRAIGQVAADRDRRKAMGAAGRLKANLQFDQQRVIEITLAAYHDVMARSSGTTAPR